MCWLFYQVGRLASGTLTFHQDVAEFHFEDYQRLLHISGCELRQAYLIILLYNIFLLVYNHQLLSDCV